jgi:hypothetical protein
MAVGVSVGGAGGAVVAVAVGSNWSEETSEPGVEVGLAVAGRGDGVGEVFVLVGDASTVTAVEVTLSPESSGVTSPEATSKPAGADSLPVQATIVSRIRANGRTSIYRFVDMINRSKS